MNAVKDLIGQAVDRLADDLEKLSRQIHDNPELAYEEVKAAGWLCDFLGAHGFKVERGVAGVATAFRGTLDTGEGPTIAILCEYDALPAIGHACGHNVIATSGVGAGAALAAVRDKLPRGHVQVIGTPAEEGGGGKVRLIRGGVFERVDAAMMIHGFDRWILHQDLLGIVRVGFEFTGKAAHASADPWEGVNALDAVIQTFNNVSMLRQQVRTDARIHGVITRGGEQANIIPEYSSAEFYLRASTVAYCQELLRRFRAAAEGAATATGCRVTVTADPTVHEPLKANPAMATVFAKNLELIDFPEDPDDGQAGYGSTDCGNVSQRLPTIHPYIRISPDGVPGHSRDFATWARSPMARTGMVAGAKALALTALDLLASPEALESARVDFRTARDG